MRQMLSLVDEVSQLFTYSSEDLDKILQKVVVLIAKSMDVEVCSIYIYDEEEQKLFMKANIGFNPDVVPKVSLTPGEGLVGLVFLENQIYFEKRADKNEFFKAFPGLGEENYPHFFGVPVHLKNKKLGVLVLQSDKKRKIGELETKVLRALSSQLAIILKNTEMKKKLLEIQPQKVQKQDAVNRRLSGKGVSSGIATGRALFLHDSKRLEEIPISRIDAKSVENEKEVFKTALESAASEMESWSHQMSERLEEVLAVVESQMMLVKDAVFKNKVYGYIEKNYSAESALKLVYEEYKLVFENMENSYFQERILDIKDVISRILSYTYQEQGLKNYEDSILVVSEMFPSYFMELNLGNIKGIVSKKVTFTSHSVILAKALKIPMLTGVVNVFDYVEEGEGIILDAQKSELIVSPDQHTVAEYKKLSEQLNAFFPKQAKGKSETKDGKRIKISANLGLSNEVSMVLKTNFHDVGLFRTEFFFLLRNKFPSLQEQYNAYSKILKNLKGKTVTFRTLDLGGDKQLSYFPLPKEENPLLGFRSVRIFKKHTQILKTQLMALMKAAASYSVQVMFPMINNYEDFMFCRSVMMEAEKELKKAKEKYAWPKLGIMIETMASIFNMRRIAPFISFVSVGTNDLLQYLLAVDRNSVYNDDAYNIYDPSFIETLFLIGEQAKQNGLELSICGEAASNPLLTPVLIGAGFDKLSMVPSAIPLIHQWVQKLDLKSIAEICNKSRDKKRALDVETQLKSFYNKLS